MQRLVGIFFAVVFMFIGTTTPAFSAPLDDASTTIRKERDFYNALYEKDKQAIVVVQVLIASSPSSPPDKEDSNGGRGTESKSFSLLKNARYDYTVEVPGFNLVQSYHMGTGFFISEEGELLTNYHVIDGYQEIYGILADGSTYILDVIGYDKAADIALLKVRTAKITKFPFLALGNSDLPVEADPIMVIGHPFNLRWTLSLGTVSKTKRSSPYPIPVIQIQSSINPGNSGSPVFAADNTVIGIAQSIIESDIGFVIPINVVKSKLSALRQRSQPLKPDIDDKKPFTFEVIVDQRILSRNGGLTKEEMVLYISRLVSHSSSIFLTQVGRPLSVIKVTFPESPPFFLASKVQNLKTAAALAWLKTLRRSTDRIVLLVDGTIIDPEGVARGGYADAPFILMTYYSDQTLTKRILLHEIGHTCGAGHLLNPTEFPENNRLMAADLGNGFMYDPKNLETIKNNCG